MLVQTNKQTNNSDSMPNLLLLYHHFVSRPTREHGT